MNRKEKGSTKLKGELIYLPIGELYPHPDNPRKELGDLTELADSIKSKGIMQNLTVIKGHILTAEEWSDLSARYNKNPTEEIRQKMNSRKTEDGYTVLIGHRRLGASKIAGVTLCYCGYGRTRPNSDYAA